MSTTQVHSTVCPIWEDKVLVCLAISFSHNFQVLVEIPFAISPLRSKNALPQGRGGVIFRRPPHHIWESLEHGFVDLDKVSFDKYFVENPFDTFMAVSPPPRGGIPLWTSPKCCWIQNRGPPWS